jgi:three-Cys-motif partner protein
LSEPHDLAALQLPFQELAGAQKEDDEQVVVALPTGPAIASDGLPARVIRPHTHEKLERHRKYCTIFNGGMKRLWPDNRGYLELFASAGLALEGEDEVDGCPMNAAKSHPPFQRMAFVEFNPVLAAALEHRLGRAGAGDRARVFFGDANDPEVLREALAFLPNPGLIFAFIDPEDINGSWDAVRFLAAQHPRQRIDFLINLPIGSMKRNRSSKAITTVLGTDEWKPRVEAGEPLGLVFRETYALQFQRLGFEVAEHTEVRAQVNHTPIYDLVFASRNRRALSFWHKIQQIEPDGQRQLW